MKKDNGQHATQWRHNSHGKDGAVRAADPAAWPWLTELSGFARRLLQLWRRPSAPPARLALIERIALGPRQVLALVEAEGVRVLVATSPEGTPAFLPLTVLPGQGGQDGQSTSLREHSAAGRVVPFRTGRVSW